MKKEKIAIIEEKIKSAFKSRYIILKMLGNGGMGCVFHVRSNVIETDEYALKVLDKEAYGNKMDFMRESEVMKSLDHPGIPKIIDVTQDESYVYMVQEYIRGEPLSVIIRKCGKISEEYIKVWMKSIASTLNYLHKQGLIHRDIKPDNIMLTHDCEIKIIDFGLARKKNEIDEADKKVFGTLSYTAPERFTKKVGTVQTDIYGFGATMYYVTTGTKPENMKSNAMDSFKIMEKNLKETTSYQIYNILTKSLAVNPYKRSVSFEQILSDLSKKENLNRNEQIDELKEQSIVVFLILAALFLTGLLFI
ncbi:serine/threonine-protein kinase [Acetobacterium sp.]|uniref:serine/threonine-protein kinase n=1 Tax=Acetobacterium sp. TaxID=1872094 RepID=UPI002F3FC10F